MLAHDCVKPYLLKARYGIEKESQRVDLQGNLAKTDHPDHISDDHPYIQRDFAETQMELITPVTNSIKQLFDYLASIHVASYYSIGKKEMLWPLSMPPKLPDIEEEIIIAKFSNEKSVTYRKSLADSYGRRKQMISGVHFNFEFAEPFIRTLFQLQSELTDYQQFKTEIYLKVARNYLHHRWFITYLYGASPLSEKNFFEDEGLKKPVRSIRNSKYGYRNDDNVRVSYDSLQKYIFDLSSLVKKGVLFDEREFYAPVRLRGTRLIKDLIHHGVQYIELRNIDLNPFDIYGISEEQVKFLHLFFLYLLWKDEGINKDEWVNIGDKYSEIVALEHPLEQTQFIDKAFQIINEIEYLVEMLDLRIPNTLLTKVKKMVLEPHETLAGRLYLECEKSSQREVAVQIAKENYNKVWDELTKLSNEGTPYALLFRSVLQGKKLL